MTRTKAHQNGDEVNDGDKVWVTITQNVNLGSYENFKIEAGYSKTIKAKDDPMDLLEEIESNLEEFIAEKIEAVEIREGRRK